ncbi:MAG: acyl-CoA dehydrogenase family protein, partial [Actinomycetota bacterium]
MRFAFSDEQRQFAAAVREFLEAECTAKDVRAAAGEGPSEERWRGLADLGVIGVLAPPAAGGLGLDEVDLVLIMEEAGRAALPEPLVETAAVVVPLLRDAAPGPGRERWLPVVARGGVMVAVEQEGTP